MPVIMPNTALNTELTQLLAQCDFLQLTTSAEAFPNSKGSGIPIIRVNTPSCSALIALQGAHLLSFQARGGKPLLWTSPNCDFSSGIALRGGIPVCLPWFGPHPFDSTRPKHGFARNFDWQLSQAKLLADGSAELIFKFASSANELFEFDFSAQLVMTLGATIKLAIGISNTDSRAFDCSWVLHTYFPIDSLQEVRVHGLADRVYLDNLENHAAKMQHGDVNFPNEVDRVFPAIDNFVSIQNDAKTESKIEIKHHNCPSVVVWNPGAANAGKIADIGVGNEQHYICVERGAVLAEKWNLAAGETKSAWMEIAEAI